MIESDREREKEVANEEVTRKGLQPWANKADGVERSSPAHLSNSLHGVSLWSDR